MEWFEKITKWSEMPANQRLNVLIVYVKDTFDKKLNLRIYKKWETVIK